MPFDSMIDYVAALDDYATVLWLECEGILPVGTADEREKELNELREQVVAHFGEEVALQLEAQ